MKSVNDIREEYCDYSKLSAQSTKDLIWHLQNDADPIRAISLATDTHLKAFEIYIVKHLDHEDDYVRELTMGCVGRLRLVEYAEKVFEMALGDPAENVRDLAIFNIGHLINEVKDKTLQHRIASYLYRWVTADPKLEENFIGAAYQSILSAMEVPYSEQPGVRVLDEEIDFNLVVQFKKKYGI